MTEIQSKKFFGTVKGGNFKLDDKQSFKDYCSLFNDRQVYITVHVAYPKASKKQFGYFHGYILRELSEHTGWTKKWWKRHLKEEFLFYQEEDGTNAVKSLEALNTKEFNEFLEDTIRYAAEEADLVLEPPGGWEPK